MSASRPSISRNLARASGSSSTMSALSFIELGGLQNKGELDRVDAAAGRTGFERDRRGVAMKRREARARVVESDAVTAFRRPASAQSGAVVSDDQAQSRT